jgi:hypothetical protein
VGCLLCRALYRKDGSQQTGSGSNDDLTSRFPRFSRIANIFVNTVGRQLEPRAFLPHWYACLRVLSIRSRGIYSCKDTYLSTVLPLKPIPWIEEQTGVILLDAQEALREVAPATHRRRGVTCARCARGVRKGAICYPR